MNALINSIEYLYGLLAKYGKTPVEGVFTREQLEKMSERDLISIHKFVAIDYGRASLLAEQAEANA
jgi:hypothetical protein